MSLLWSFWSLWKVCNLLPLLWKKNKLTKKCEYFFFGACEVAQSLQARLAGLYRLYNRGSSWDNFCICVSSNRRSIVVSRSSGVDVLVLCKNNFCLELREFWQPATIIVSKMSLGPKCKHCVRNCWPSVYFFVVRSTFCNFLFSKEYLLCSSLW